MNILNSKNPPSQQKTAEKVEEESYAYHESVRDGDPIETLDTSDFDDDEDAE